MLLIVRVAGCVAVNKGPCGLSCGLWGMGSAGTCQVHRSVAGTSLVPGLVEVFSLIVSCIFTLTHLSLVIIIIRPADLI